MLRQLYRFAQRCLAAFRSRAALRAAITFVRYAGSCHSRFMRSELALRTSGLFAIASIRAR